MRKKLTALALSLLMAISLVITGVSAADPVTLYGFRCYDGVSSGGAGNAFVTFSSDAPGGLTVSAAQPDLPNVFCGTYAGGVFYGVDEKGGLFTVSFDSFSRTAIAPAIVDTASWEPSEMTFDYSYGRLIMLALNRQTDAATRALFAIDISTGTATKLCEVGGNILLRTLAADPDGKLYGIDLNGDLYTVDATSGAATLIGSTGRTVQFTQSMCFDRQTGVLYWARFGGKGDSVLCTVNKDTAETTDIGAISGGAEISGLCVASDAFRVSFANETGGSAGDSGGGFYKEGDRVTISATPDKGYKFGGWVTSAGVLTSQTDAMSTLVMPSGDVIVKAFFIPSDSYNERTLLDSPLGISVAGSKIYYNAALSGEPWAEGEDGYDAVLEKAGKKEIIGAYQLAIMSQAVDENTAPNKGSVTVSVTVGTQYEGKKMTVWQLIDGKVTGTTAKVKDGVLSYKTQAVSPMAYAEGGGSSFWTVLLIILIVLLLLVGAYILRMRALAARRRRKAAELRRKRQQASGEQTVQPRPAQDTAASDSTRLVQTGNYNTQTSSSTGVRRVKKRSFIDRLLMKFRR